MSFYNNWDSPTLVSKVRTFDAAEVESAIQQIKFVIGWRFNRAVQVGSNYILGKGVDLDIVVHAIYPLAHAEGLLKAASYTISENGSGDAEDDNFRCFRKGDVNVMLTADEEWYGQFVKSAEVCRAMHLLGLGIDMKAARIAVHRVLMDDEDAKIAVANALAAV